MNGYLTAIWLMIIFSFLSLLLVHELRNRDRNNIIWTYLLWVCSALALFAVSRSAGHILKQALLLSGQGAVWNTIQPVSGGINTLTFIVVASGTLFFEQIWRVYRQISNDKKVLRSDDLLDVFMGRVWEGNVREMENLIMQGILFSPGARIRPRDVGLENSGTPTCLVDSTFQDLPYKQAKEQALQQVMRRYRIKADPFRK